MITVGTQASCLRLGWALPISPVKCVTGLLTRPGCLLLLSQPPSQRPAVSSLSVICTVNFCPVPCMLFGFSSPVMGRHSTLRFGDLSRHGGKTPNVVSSMLVLQPGHQTYRNSRLPYAAQPVTCSWGGGAQSHDLCLIGHLCPWR